MKQELLSSERVIELANKNFYVMSLPATAPVSFVHVREENDFVGEVDGSDCDKCSAAMKMYDLLKHASKTVCGV